MKYLFSLALVSLITTTSFAQLETTLPIDTARQSKGKTSISIGSGGVVVRKGGVTVAGRDSAKTVFELQFGMLDLGFNRLDDKTDYANANLPTFTNYGRVDKELFSLRNGKSINVNVYPVLIKANLLRTRGQKLILTTGVGLQLYNFRFNKPVSYQNYEDNYLRYDNVAYSKNKLVFNYLSVPLLLTSKTRISRHGDGGRGTWLVYGAGVSVGYRLSSWTKQISAEHGKDKVQVWENFSDTNLCVNGEFGLDGFFRLFATYQLTPLHENTLVQHPFAFGIRFLGI